jgi:hypothetical protein
MAFGTGYLDDPQNIGAGERLGTVHAIFSATTFEDGLKVGRFAKLDTDSIDNFDGSATPVVAGVVLRNVANPVEDLATIDADLYSQVEYMRQGLVTVDVKTGETPAKYGRVYISNAGDASDGLATATNTDIPANAEFIEEVQAGVWLIYITPAPGDVATHVGDATASHAASAISLLDTAGLTASDDVEEVIVEMLPAVSGVAVIADPGDAGAIPVTRSGNCAITTAGAETRTIAAPATVGITLALSCDVDAGDAVVTVASAFNQTGNNTITLNDAGDTVVLTSVQVGSAVVWRLVVNDGATLATV